MILPTDIPTRSEIDRPLEHRGHASVSIYVPTDPASKGDAERIELDSGRPGVLPATGRRGREGSFASSKTRSSICTTTRSSALPGQEPGVVRDAAVADHVQAPQSPAQPGRGTVSKCRRAGDRALSTETFVQLPGALCTRRVRPWPFQLGIASRARGSCADMRF